MQISFAVTAKLISAFVLATWMVQFLYYLNPKFQASSHLLCLYISVCVGTGRKPELLVFSRTGSNGNECNSEWDCLSYVLSDKDLYYVPKYINVAFSRTCQNWCLMLAICYEYCKYMLHDRWRSLCSIVQHKPACTTTIEGHKLVI